MKILFVCMGNICRSPTAKGVFDHILEAAGIQFTSESAGTLGYHVGEPPDDRAVQQALARGFDIRADRARRLAASDFRRFDLILAMDRANLERLEQMRPADARARVQLIMELAPDYGIDEVPDPYYGGQDGFRQVLDMLETAARNLASELTGESGGA